LRTPLILDKRETVTLFRSSQIFLVKEQGVGLVNALQIHTCVMQFICFIYVTVTNVCKELL